MMTKYLLLFLGFLPVSLRAQEAPTYTKWNISPILGMQAWSTYTMGQQEYNADAGSYFDVDDRLNFMVRRLRFGSTADITDRLFFKFLGAADFVGSDQRAGTVGGVNNGAFPNLQVWDLYLRYKLSADNESAYVIGGFLRPPVGRESMSGAFGVSAFEKSFSHFYVRQHMTVTGPGGTGGVYLGGLLELGEKMHVDYRGGVFNPFNNGISAGVEAAPLLAGRVNFMFGQPENEKWRYGLKANYFGKRRGVSVAIAGSDEGATGAALQARSLGLDFLINVDQLHLEGEYITFSRKITDQPTDRFYQPDTYFARIGYNLPVKTPEGKAQRYLEPSVLAYGFNGAEAGVTTAAEATNYFVGSELAIDVGINYHVVPGKLKLALHYISRSGESGSIEPDFPFLNQYFYQGGIGGIQRGDYLAFGVALSR